MTLQPGQMLSYYRLARRIGAGGMGEVWKAVAALNHPNIVTLFSVEEADGVPFITMELVEGKTLADVIPDDGVTRGEFFDLGCR